MNNMLRIMALVVLLGCSVGFASDFCAITITVVSPGGEVTQYPFPVTLRDSSDKVVEEAVLQNGKASFCDFGFGDHSLVVGEEMGCSPIIIRHLRLRLGYH